LVGEYLDDSSGKEYVYLDGLLVGAIARLDNGKERYAIYADHLGTPRTAEHIDSGEVTWQWLLTGAPFGEDPAISGSSNGTIEVPLETNLRFPGQYRDAESGLHYNYFRDYEPATGRYIESDPIGLTGGLSTFTYVTSSPLRATDPRGEQVVVPIPGPDRDRRHPLPGTTWDRGDPPAPNYPGPTLDDVVRFCALFMLNEAMDQTESPRVS
jgi:RHS repeat-associated protein